MFTPSQVQVETKQRILEINKIFLSTKMLIKMSAFSIFLPLKNDWFKN